MKKMLIALILAFSNLCLANSNHNISLLSYAVKNTDLDQFSQILDKVKYELTERDITNLLELSKDAIEIRREQNNLFEALDLVVALKVIGCGWLAFILFKLGVGITVGTIAGMVVIPPFAPGIALVGVPCSYYSFKGMMGLIGIAQAIIKSKTKVLEQKYLDAVTIKQLIFDRAVSIN